MAYEKPSKTKTKAIELEKLELDNDIFSNEDQRRGRPEYFMPAGTEVLRVLDYMEIELGIGSKEKEGRNAMALFSVVWNIIIFGVVWGAVSSFSLPFLLFMFIFSMVGLFGFVMTLKKFINRKKVLIRNGLLEVKEGPIKVGSHQLTIHLDDIEQLYVSKYFTGTTVNDKRIMAYSLSAITSDKKSIRIIEGSNLETVQYLEQEVERFLDITDKPVYGEIL